MALRKKDPYTEILHYSLLKCSQDARQTAWTVMRERKETVEGVCEALELPVKKVGHWLDWKKKLVMSKAPRDRDIMVLLRYLGVDVSVVVRRS